MVKCWLRVYHGERVASKACVIDMMGVRGECAGMGSSWNP